MAAGDVLDDRHEVLRQAVDDHVGAELAQRRQAARLEQADRVAEALQHVVAQWLGEEAINLALSIGSATLRSRHDCMVIE